MADEIVQSVFATAAVKLRAGEYAERGRFEPWLFRVTMNRLRDEMRRVRRQATPTDPIAMRDLSLASPDARPGHAELSSLDRLRRALHELSPQDREIIELRHHGGLSFNQLSELLDEPLGTLLARHHRALKKLQAILSPHGRDRADEEHDS